MVANNTDGSSPLRTGSHMGTVPHVSNQEPIGVTEAAARLRMTRRGVHKAIHRGDLPARKLPGRTGAYVLDPADVERYADTRLSA